jgi:hypothetical protein
MMMRETIAQDPHQAKMIMSSMESGSNLHGHLQLLHEGPWLHDHE